MAVEHLKDVDEAVDLEELLEGGDEADEGQQECQGFVGEPEDRAVSDEGGEERQA